MAASLAFALDWEADAEAEEETAAALEEAPCDPLLLAALVAQAASENTIATQNTIPIIALNFFIAAPFHAGILHPL